MRFLQLHLPPVEISFDPAKRIAMLATRGLDFLDASEMFAGRTHRFIDDRADYGEVRTAAVGYLRGRTVVIAFADRPGGRHIISMRKANDRERRHYRLLFD